MTDSGFAVDDHVDIISGKYIGRQGIVKKLCPQKIQINLLKPDASVEKSAPLWLDALQARETRAPRERGANLLPTSPGSSTANASFVSARSVLNPEHYLSARNGVSRDQTGANPTRHPTRNGPTEMARERERPSVATSRASSLSTHTSRRQADELYDASERAGYIQVERSSQTFSPQITTAARPGARSSFTPSQTSSAVSSPSRRRANVSEQASAESSPWAVPGAHNPDLHTELGLAIGVIQLESPASKSSRKRTMAYQIFGDRLLHFEIPISAASKTVDQFDANFPPKTYTKNLRTYELLCADLKLESTPTSYGSIRTFKIWLQYVLVSGPDLEAINIQDALERVCGLGSLGPRKDAARLKLFNSPAFRSNKKEKDFMIYELKVSDFEEIDEPTYFGYAKFQGTGFIPRSYIEQFMGTHARGKRTSDFQVRIFGPALGVFKGVLTEKPGISRIQLPWSMMKVGPSRTSSNVDSVCLIVAGAGIHPTSTNVHVGNILSGAKKPPESFIPNKLSDMIKTLWKMTGVSGDTINAYAENSRQRFGEGLEHASILGVPDPTDWIPAGHVFVPGLGNVQDEIDTIFVTRFPCTEAVDAKMLPLLKEKPAAMSSSFWAWLNNLHFGKIYFGHPSSEDDSPLPPTIANGDCDGDFYFICWNKDILAQCRPPTSVRSCPRGNDDAPIDMVAYNPNWFDEARAQFFDLRLMVEISQLIKKLYKPWKDEWKKDEGARNVADADAFGRAFKASLDLEKQGKKPYLPRHLWGEIPEHLHHLLSDSIDESYLRSETNVRSRMVSTRPAAVRSTNDSFFDANDGLQAATFSDNDEEDGRDDDMSTSIYADPMPFERSHVSAGDPYNSAAIVSDSDTDNEMSVDEFQDAIAHSEPLSNTDARYDVLWVPE